MRELQYLKNRLLFAFKGSGKLTVTQNDVEALNAVIRFTNTLEQNTQLEDSLLLFYILQQWKVENRENEHILFTQRTDEELGKLKISGADVLLNKISSLILPKKELIKQITNELRIHQVQNKISKEKLIQPKQVEELLEKTLVSAKTNFPLLGEMSRIKVEFSFKNNFTNAEST